MQRHDQRCVHAFHLPTTAQLNTLSNLKILRMVAVRYVIPWEHWPLFCLTIHATISRPSRKPYGRRLVFPRATKSSSRLRNIATFPRPNAFRNLSGSFTHTLIYSRMLVNKVRSSRQVILNVSSHRTREAILQSMFQSAGLSSTLTMESAASNTS